MKVFSKIITPVAAFAVSVAALSLTIVSCSDDNYKPEVTGSPYEVLIVADDSLWPGPVCDTLYSILHAPVPMLFHFEPLFNLARTTPRSFMGLLIKHRNILRVEVDPKAEEPSMAIQYDVNAKPQTFITASGRSPQEIAAYMGLHREELEHVLDMSERERDLAFFRKYHDITIENAVEKQFDFTMAVPRGYTIRDSKKGFMWISHELRVSSQGIIIYTYPYKDKSDFSPEALTARRNQFTALIPGPSAGSYMTTADVEPEVEYMRINGRFWAEMRGFWDVKNDFMGGPFMSYSTLDTQNHRVITIDTYVYSPRDPRRNFMRQLEHLIYTVRLPGDPEPRK